MTYACGKTVVDVEKVVDVVRSAGAAIMQVYTEDAKVKNKNKKQPSYNFYWWVDGWID